MLRVRAFLERVRGSLFYIPALYVVVAVGLAWGVVRLETAAADVVRALPLVTTTVESARSVLTTIAAATITVAGIVFSVTVVSVQLASSQFSPRVLRGFLRDRFQQGVIGVVVGTFSYCLFVLVGTRLSEPGAELSPAPSLAVTIAIVLALAAIVAIIAFIDHSARSMQAGEIIRRVTAETHELIDRMCTPVGEAPPGSGGTAVPSGPGLLVRADAEGWVQQLDPGGLLEAAPPGATLRLDVRVGSFVAVGMPLCTVWAPDLDDDRAEEVADAVRGSVAVGGARTMQQDIAFGVRQLVDIAVRALSPGINDPTTAYEAIVHLGALLAHVAHRDLPPRVRTDDEGRTLVAAADLDHADLVERAFAQVRVAAASHPSVSIAILRVIGDLEALLRHRGLDDRIPPLREQAALVVAGAVDAIDLAHDRDRVRAVAAELDLLPTD